MARKKLYHQAGGYLIIGRHKRSGRAYLFDNQAQARRSTGGKFVLIPARMVWGNPFFKMMQWTGSPIKVESVLKMHEAMKVFGYVRGLFDKVRNSA